MNAGTTLKSLIHEVEQPVSITQAGIRIRSLHEEIMKLGDVRHQSRNERQRSAYQAMGTLQLECDALIDYACSHPAKSFEDGLTLIDLVTLQSQALADEQDLPEGYREHMGRVIRTLCSVADLLSRVSGIGLDQYTFTGMDQVYSMVYPQTARSGLAVSEAGER